MYWLGLQELFPSVCYLLPIHILELFCVFYLMYAQFHLFLFSLCLSFMSVFLAAFLRSVKPWPPVWNSPYGPTAGIYSLSFCLVLVGKGAHMHVLSFISVSSLSAAIGLAVAAPVSSFALGTAAGV